jgi:4-amino-4-deoxy-L-arabinose transferase-like glycosyltransferase
MALQKITNHRTGLLILLIIALVLSVTGMNGKPFYSKGEPREALVSQSMVESGNWILPKRYGDEFATKPPLSHWIAASFAKVIGKSDELTSRLPSLLMSIISLAAIFTLFTREVSIKVGFTTALILLTSIEWHRASITARVDMTLSGMILIALYSLYTWERIGFKKYPLLALIGLTGAMLSKGPVGIILPVGICGLHFLFQGRTLRVAVTKLLIVALPSLIFSLLWYWSAYSKGGEAFLDVVILENFARFQGSMEAGEDPHTHSAFYLYGTLFLGMMPWALGLFTNILGFFGNLPKILPKILTPKDLAAKFRTLSSIDRFSWIAVIAYLIFFSIPSSKRSVYLLPIYPFISYLIARTFLAENTYTKKAEMIIRNLVLILSIFLVAALFVAPWLQLNEILSGLLPKKSQEIAFYLEALAFSGSFAHLGIFKLAILAVSIILVVINYLKSRQKDEPIIFTALSICLFLVIANCSIITATAKKLSASEWISTVNPILENNPTFTWREKNYGLNYYLHGRLQVVNEPSDIKTSSFIFIKSSDLEIFKESFYGYHIEKTSESPNPLEKSDRFYLLYKISPP